MCLILQHAEKRSVCFLNAVSSAGHFFLIVMHLDAQTQCIRAKQSALSPIVPCQPSFHLQCYWHFVCCDKTHLSWLTPVLPSATKFSFLFKNKLQTKTNWWSFYHQFDVLMFVVCAFVLSLNNIVQTETMLSNFSFCEKTNAIHLWNKKKF